MKMKESALEFQFRYVNAAVLVAQAEIFRSSKVPVKIDVERPIGDVKFGSKEGSGVIECHKISYRSEETGFSLLVSSAAKISKLLELLMTALLRNDNLGVPIETRQAQQYLELSLNTYRDNKVHYAASQKI